MPIFPALNPEKVEIFTEQTFWGNVEELTLPLSIADSRDRTLSQFRLLEKCCPNFVSLQRFHLVLHQRYQR